MLLIYDLDTKQPLHPAGVAATATIGGQMQRVLAGEFERLCREAETINDGSR